MQKDKAPKVVKAVSRETIASVIVAIIQKDVDAKLRETGGYNRSPRIDQFNKRTHAPLASSYCMSGAWCAIDDACKALGLKNPVPATAGSQTGYTQAPGAFRSTMHGRKGGLAIFQQRHDPVHGHATTLAEDQSPGAHEFQTLEYNTGPDGGRDGDGAYRKTRSLAGDHSKKFRGFVDTVGWIMKANGILESVPVLRAS